MENTAFTIRPSILPGESFWSYLLRTARQNGIRLLTAANSIKLWEKKYVQRSDFGLLDITPASFLDIDQLSNLTGLSAKKLLAATFAPLLRTFGTSEEIQRARFMSGMISETYRYCPLCLKEALYFRLIWKMSSVTSCVRHRVVLVDTCPVCDMKIRFQDVEWLNECPYCAGTLTKSKFSTSTDDELEQQKWMHDALNTLLEPRDRCIEPSEAAMSLLYLLCGRQSQFDRKLTEARLPSVLPTLLQHARDSLSQKRALHLSFLLNTLYENNLSVNEFISADVPKSFAESVRKGLVRKSDQLFCLAPWCENSQQRGTLVKTGTTLKRRKSGETLSYYLACSECGCEYAIAEDGSLQERSYFIKGYQAFKKEDISLIGIKELARRSGYSEDKTRRCLAYLCTRLKAGDWGGLRVEVDVLLLERFLNDIRKETNLKVIQKWECWESYQQFLIYRFHPKVMHTLIELKRPRLSKRSDNVVKREKVLEALDRLLGSDEDITINTVCRIVGVCPETIRMWGCNKFIAEAKNLQCEQRIQSRKHEIYEKIDSYLSQNMAIIVRSVAVYNVLEINRTVLWRNAPEITAYIHQRITHHNRIVKEMQRD